MKSKSRETLKRKTKQQIDQELEMVAELEKRYVDLQKRLKVLQTEEEQSYTELFKHKKRVANLRTYLKDLDNKITPGLWYTFTSRWLPYSVETTPLVYVVNSRRPKKYTYLSMYYIEPVLDYSPFEIEKVKDQYRVAFIEAKYPLIADYLREETQQNKMGLLMKWGLSEEKLLAKLRDLWKDKQPAKIKKNKILWSMKHSSTASIIDLKGSK